MVNKDDDRIIVIDNLFENKTYKIRCEQLKFNKKLTDMVLNYNKKNIYSISHIQDFDGVASSSVIVDKFAIPKENIFFISYNAEDVKKVSSFLKKKLSDSIVIVTDISMNDYLVPNFKSLIKIIHDSNSKLLWLDHHPWSEYSVKNLSKFFDFGIVGENRLYCAAELAHIVFSNTNTGTSKIIADRAHITDFNIKKDYKGEPNISFAINYFGFDKKTCIDNLRTLATKVANREFKANMIRRASDNYNAEFDSNMKMVIDNIILKNYNKYKIAFGFGKSFNSTQICEGILNNTHADLIVYLKTDSNSGTLRRGNDDLNCSKIANALNGGGHPFAAGFPIPKKFNIKSKQGKINLIEYFIKNTTPVLN